jgi:5-methyltetrahydrofolate--homocysteine methyltransferase
MSKDFLKILQNKVIVFDGATGTYLQGQNLNSDDFGGEHLAGCNEYLVVSKPSVVEKMHREYLETGCDVIETNSFGSTRIVLAEYGLEDCVYELNLKAAQIAKHAATEYSCTSHQCFVAGSMGPTTKLPSLGHISFKDMAAAYHEQVKGLIEGGVDLLCVETCQDILQSKAALYGIFKYFRQAQHRVPVIVSVTIESIGTMLLGTEISAALTSLEPYDIDVIGINCATGPKEMSEHVRTLADISPKPIIVMPNAGMPENIDGKAHYHLSPNEFTSFLTHFVKNLNVSIVGGCCGTTPEHIRQLVDSVSNLTTKKREYEFVPGVSSLFQSVPFKIENPPILIGERTNANGSKFFRDLLAKEDWEGIVALGREQVREGAHLLDVCAAYVGRDEVSDICEIVSRFNQQVTIPLMIDSTEPLAIEEALQRISGKAIINSVNLEDGEERFSRILQLCKKYGAAVVALTIDEEGMAKTVEKKLAIARRIYNLATNKYGMKPYDLIFDALTFTLGSGDEGFRRSAIQTIEAIRSIKEVLPGVHTSLGVSNVSFGLSPAARSVLNSVFLHYAVEAGLDMAIVHASKIRPLYKIDEKGREIARQLIFDERKWEGQGENRRLVFDPLVEFMAFYSGKKKESKEIEINSGSTVEERLKNRIIDGDKVGVNVDLDEALKKYSPIDIINTILLDGMKVVGDLFGSGQMQLPFVLQSAEVMKSTVAYLESFMGKTGGSKKGTMVIATVKGDVHDIGKNLVDIILTNNGYKVINLGIKCSVEKMIEAAKEHNADAIGMSGLLVKSTLVMKENLEVMNEQNLTIPVVLGGAALTRQYVEQNLRSIYNGLVHYANDAFDGLKLMEQIITGKTRNGRSNTEIIEDIGESTLSESGMKIEPATKEEGKTLKRSKVRTDVNIPIPPFWGTRIVEDLSLDEVFKYINETALFRGQWRIVRGKRSEEEYRKIIEQHIYPEYIALKSEVRNQSLLKPKVVYGYFPCQSDGNDLIIYHPIEQVNLQSTVYNLKSFKEWLRFTFPRQTDDRFLCISDFFASVDSGKIDIVAFQMVTIGKKASEYSKRLFDSNEYKDYLYFHGLSVETTEALAELWHKHIREELVIAGKDSLDIKRLFSKNYQGARYSFGYPACPNLEDHKKLFDLLQPERIGVTMTNEFMLNPEQSTDAIIVHHPEAKYFNVKNP